MPDTETCAAFHAQNQWVRAGGVVLFGADFFAALPVAELNSYFQVESAVYNRSVSGLSVFEAEQLLDVCVLELHPSKVFVNLGERDVTAASLETVEAAAAQLEWLLYQIHSRAPACELILTSVLQDGAAAELYNGALRDLARSCGCRFLDLTPAAGRADVARKAYSLLKTFFRSGKLSFCDAMRLQTV